ncbi:hypothetical protein BX600DRAFT_476947 [Xylariales sp. PMI_506]|nr:hypothetical protein BX600DRAFT_476947 [Xylariales sp. PMI_506]
MSTISVATMDGGIPDDDLIKMPHTTSGIPITLDNSGRGLLRVPGFNNIPIHYELPPDGRFAHGMVEWRQAPAVTARELTMTAVMNQLTDRPKWYVDVHDDRVVARWREETFATMPLMSDMAWDWCLKELRDKADYFCDKHHVRVLDTGSCVCKSDTEMLSSLGASFRQAALPLLQQQENELGRKRNSQGDIDRQSSQLLRLVDPLLYPLVYGRSLVLAGGGTVDLPNIFDSYHNSKIAPNHFDRRVNSQAIQEEIDEGYDLPRGLSAGGSTNKFYRWSSDYQSVPCEVEFLHDVGTEVQITSYINNLHPAHKEMYHAIEKLVSMAITPWNDCLVQGQHGWNDSLNYGQLGPVPLRIITYGVEWENEVPDWVDAFQIISIPEKRMYDIAEKRVQDTKDDQTKRGRKRHLKAKEDLFPLRYVSEREHIELPPSDSELWQKAKEYLELPEDESNTPVESPDGWDKGSTSTWSFLKRKAKRLLRFKHPEPGTAFSYENWKSGQHNDKAIIDINRHRIAVDGRHLKPYIPSHNPYTIRLENTFRKHGLQVIVKMENIELTPEAPMYEGSAWELEGQLNEHIAAVAVFSYDVANITEPRIEFRQYTYLHGCFYQYNEHLYTRRDQYHWKGWPAHRLVKTPGTELGAIAEILGYEPLQLSVDRHDTAPFQSLGSVAALQGRLITFPSVLEHRQEPFQLADPTIPGHYRSIKLYLVDPHYRICSTRNVPPQQHHWWAKEAGKILREAGLPNELVDKILEETSGWPMGAQEARDHRRDLVKQHHWNEMTKLGLMSGPGF